MNEDIVDDVNALLKLGVGDSYRLEHIKQAYMDNKTVWITDTNYLKKLKEKYLSKQAEVPDGTEEGKIHCWKCGRKIELGANFCMACGSALFEVGTETQRVERPSAPADAKRKSLKIPIIIGIPLLIVLAAGGAYYGGALDWNVGVAPAGTVPAAAPAVPADPDDPASKCGAGTVLDPDTGECVLDRPETGEFDPDDPASKCSPGTVYNQEKGWCEVP